MNSTSTRNSEDSRLRRELGPISLAAITFTSMVGSGWLFAAYYASQRAGSLSLISWVIAGFMTLLVGLVYIELAIARPLSGGNIRWPQIAFGPLFGTLIGWVTFLQVAVAAGSEVAGLLQYGAHWWPSLYADGSLTGKGLVVGLFINASFTLAAWWGIRKFAHLNNVLTIPKLAIPILTIILLIVSGFDSNNFSHASGESFGTAGVLNAVVTGGLIYSFGGIYHVAQMSGEVRNPKRDIPIGTLLGLGITFLLYIGLQVAYLGAVPHDMLEKAGWSGINFDSPFAQLAVLVNLGWLGWLLVADGVYSPAATQYATTGMDARSTYGIAQNRTFPIALAKVHEKSGVPRRALLLNFVIGTLLLVFFASWHSLVSALGMFFAVSYAVVSVTVTVFRKAGINSGTKWGSVIPYVAAASFVMAGMIIYWSGWDVIKSGIPLFLLGLVVYAVNLVVNRAKGMPSGFLNGIWFVAFIVTIGAISWIGSFDGLGMIGHPWDTVLVGLVSAVFYVVGVKSGTAWMRSQAVEGDREQIVGSVGTAVEAANILVSLPNPRNPESTKLPM